MESGTTVVSVALNPLEDAAGIGTLRFLTCGSVDDGKSTLIGRLLHDSKLVPEDVAATLVRDSAKHGTTGEELDFALLVDGLEAEREQGITIDVAWRFFATPKRRFIVADCPGHEQYTRNMATGASNADLAVVLLDVRAGVLTQTRRHSAIAALMGIRHIVLAVNKIDLIEFDQARFDEVQRDYLEAVRGLGFEDVTVIPMSARYGDNVAARSHRMPWYTGPSLLEHMEQVDVQRAAAARAFRMPVQWVNRPNQNFRGYAGTIAAGAVRAGDVVGIAGSNVASKVARIATLDGDLDEAGVGQAVTLVLADQVDASRGDVLAQADALPAVVDQFDANLVWLTDAPLFPGRTWLVKLGTKVVAGSISRIRHRIDVNTFEHITADQLGVNDVARVSMSLTTPVAMERFVDVPDLGGFILIDRLTNATVGVGMVEDIQTHAPAVIWHRMTVDKVARATMKGQKPVAMWFTGLSGSGKSTIANLLEKRLHADGRHTFILDGDNVRHGLNKDLGFSEADRVENIRRAAEASKLMVDAGLIVLVSFISPYRSDRQAARDLFDPDEFIEVFIDTPIEECQRRDPKGLYRRVAAGEIRNFTGIDAPYEAPDAAEIHVRTMDAPPEQQVEMLLRALKAEGIIS
jgi:bifunctional enzyme CysN/CysC